MTEAQARRRAPIDVFRYLDYRAFLADVYDAQKARGLSYRAFSRRAKLGAPNYLKLVIEGQRNLTPQMAQRFAVAADLSDDAVDYFCALVRFGQATASADKAREHERLLSHKRFREAHRLDVSHAEYHGAWYVPAIRELVASPSFEDDPRWIAKKLQPAIKPSEAASGLKTLLKLGLVVRDGQGRLTQTAGIVSTGAETQGLHIARYHREMMTRASAAIDEVASEQRDISSLTVCVSEAGLQRLKRRLQEMRRELLELAESDAPRERVVQLNMQLFPLSHGAEARTTARKRTHQKKVGVSDDKP